MAKQQAARGSRSQAIREYLSRHSTASPKDVVAGLKGQGIEVKEGLVSNIKYSKKTKTKSRRIRRAAPENGTAVARSNVEGRGSRSQAVRDYLDENPTATPTEIVSALQLQGITISLSLAAQVKYKRSRGSGGRILKRASEGHRTRLVAVGRSISANDLIEAKKLADSLGGLENARKALELLAQLR